LQPTFADLGLSPKVLEAVTAAGYTIPTPIQAAAIPVANEGRDVLGIAQTGTGKTASFVLPMLTRLERGRARARMPRSLILAPTRELAAQVEEHFNRFGTNHKLTVALLIGGVSFEEQNKKLDRGADVLIATPGRLLDQFQRGKILMTGVEILVIDEADRMLDMGFIPDIERICSLLPPVRQTLFFSATMPPEITRLVERFLKDPQRIEVAKQATTASTITQRFLRTPSDPKAKRSVLRNLIRSQDTIKNAIIFCNRKRDVAILHKSLERHGFNAGALHGDMDQHQRTATLDGFRSGQITFLAASDVAARGLDIPEVSHVFNYDVPVHSDDYVHRIGRTGRAGREGFSATLVTLEDAKMMRMIEKMVGVESQWIDGIEPETSALGGESGREGGRGRGGRERGGRERGGRDRSSPPGQGGQGGRGRGRVEGRNEGRGEVQALAPDDAVVAIPSHIREVHDDADEIETLGGAGIETDFGGAAGGERREPREGRRSSRPGSRSGGDSSARSGDRDSSRRNSRSGESRSDGASEARQRDADSREGREGHGNDGDQNTPPSIPRDGGRGGDHRSGRGAGRNDRRPETQSGTQSGNRSENRPERAPDQQRADHRPESRGGEARPEQRRDRNDRSDRNDRHNRPDRRGGGGSREDSPVVGLGDHVPDFLKRPVKIIG
jgi:superfamily II DNA/RNA helicase